MGQQQTEKRSQCSNVTVYTMHLFYMDAHFCFEFHHHHHHHHKKMTSNCRGKIPADAIRLLLLILCYNITTTVISLRASSEHYNISYESLVLPQEVDNSFQTVPGKTIQKISPLTRTPSIALCPLSISLFHTAFYNTMCITPQLLATFSGQVHNATSVPSKTASNCFFYNLCMSSPCCCCCCCLCRCRWLPTRVRHAFRFYFGLADTWGKMQCTPISSPSIVPLNRAYRARFNPFRHSFNCSLFHPSPVIHELRFTLSPRSSLVCSSRQMPPSSWMLLR